MSGKFNLVEMSLTKHGRENDDELAVLCLRLLVAGLSPRRPGLVNVGFVALGHFLPQLFGIPLSISFHRGSPYSCHMGDEKNRPVGSRSSETVSNNNNNNSGNVLLGQGYRTPRGAV
jgi:hypothetical protein